MLSACLSKSYPTCLFRSLVSWERYIYNGAFRVLWYCFETWHPFKVTFSLPFCLDKNVAIISHARQLAIIMARKNFLSPQNGNFSKWQLFFWQKSCHNYGKKIFSKSPQWQLLKMATFFHDKKVAIIWQEKKVAIIILP